MQPSTPNHLAFIVDGNRRWARARNLPTLEGHRRGFNRVELVIEEVAKRKIPFTSFYLFSTENWNRSPEEVSYLMDLIRHNLPRLTKKMQKLNLRCAWLGREERVAPDLATQLRQAEEFTQSGTAGTIGICFNYGGQQELADACTAILHEKLSKLHGTNISTKETSPEYLYSEDHNDNIYTNDISSEQLYRNDTSTVHPVELTGKDIAEQTEDQPTDPSPSHPIITPSDLAAHLYHPEIPPCDLIVRTSGEERISGFMLWRAAYSEFLFLDKYFPDISADDLDFILDEYTTRQRRFGR